MFVPAKAAHDCLSNIPVDQNVTLTTIDQLRRYMAFYATQAYWKNPPCPELELSPVNINGTFDMLATGVKNGTYKTDYAVNVELHKLFSGRWDFHTQFNPICYVGLFTYKHSHPLISVASAPDQLPAIHLAALSTTDRSIQVGDQVTAINGGDPVDYLKKLATSPEHGFTDPDTRFNYNLVHLENGLLSAGYFAGRGIYPGDDPLVITVQNGTNITADWKASFNMNSVDFDSTSSLYKTICLRSQAEQDAITNPNHAARRRSVPREIATPRAMRSTSISRRADGPAAVWPADVSKRGMVINTKGGELIYYPIDKKTAVYIVTAFQGTGDDFSELFSNFTTSVIEKANATGIEKLLIDVSGNEGGTVELAMDMARQLFPASPLFFGTNLRWNPYLAAMLETGDQTDISSSVFALNQYTAENGSRFLTFNQELGPIFRDNDYFTPIEVQDEKVANSSGDMGLSMAYNKPQPFKTENVVMLSNGICGSSCTVFTEALHSVGVKAVAVGGRPAKGPMQYAGGMKGCWVMELDDIVANQWDFTGEGDFDYGDYPSVLNIRLTSGRVNFANQFRKNDGRHLPLEFLYTPADWRLAYTGQTATNFTALWAAAADAAWGDAKDISGGAYKPAEGLDGAGWSGPDGTPTPLSSGTPTASGSASATSGGAKSTATGGGGSGSGNGDDKDPAKSPALLSQKPVGELIWSVMRGKDLPWD